MRNKTVIVPCVLAVLIFFAATAGVNAAGPIENAQQIAPKLLNDRWSADWIAPSGAPPFDFGVYHFRRRFDLDVKPSSFVVHVSGDNRYQLFVNGARVAWGPARGDLFHWRFETVDIAPYLKAGRNALAAVVWNFSQMAPMAQITSQTGFVLQGDTQAQQIVDTNASWKAIRNTAYEALPVTFEEMHGYFVAGPGEKVDGRQYPWGWEQTDFDDSAWPAADVIVYASARDARDSHSPWMLVPRSIPCMEEKPERFTSVRQSRGTTVPDQFPYASGVLQVPAWTKMQLLLDQSYLTTAFPEVVVSGGRGASVTLRYAESLFKVGPHGLTKGNRNEVEGKEFIGYHDVFIADGGRQRSFRPLWWRTYRYVELTIETLDAPLTVEDLRGVYTGYPFVRRARLEVSDPSESRRLGRILDTGWRTARLCAHETYMDCPYYEQLQYVGDTRIQGLVSLYMAGDARLLRNAIDQINDSRVPEGATMSRAPTRLQQFIPPFSLWWVGMVHDYWMYQDDPAFVKEMLPGVRSVLSFFSVRQKPNGSLGRLPWWSYVDWVNQWTDGVPPVGKDGSSALLDLQLLLAMDWAAEMEGAMGSKALAAEYGSKATQLRSAIQQLYWDPDRNLYADTPDKKEYSQFANALAVLAGVIRGPVARDLVDRILADRDLVQCTYYSRFYLYSAVNHVGAGDRYLDLLGEWDAMLARGLTTWAETPESPEHTSRSDSHAWSAHPNFELFRTVLGVDSVSPGFSKVIIRPFLGKLKGVSGIIPHPKGEISVKLTRSGKELEAEISLPPGVTGSLQWGGASHPLPAGKSRTKI